MSERPKQTKKLRWLRAGGVFALSLTIMLAFLMLIGPAIALPFESPLVDIQLWLLGLGPLVTSIFLASLAWSGADLREARKKKQKSVLLTGFGIGLVTFLLGLVMSYIISPQDPLMLERQYEFGKRNFQGANLSYGFFYFESLSNVNLKGADLRSARFGVAVDLSGSDLSNANLNGAYLRKANLSGANLTGASLIGANLQDANLDGAILTGANLFDAIVTEEQLAQAQSLAGAILPSTATETP